ncbi:FAN1 [Cordylochernes scorpioides]|uniref:Fanconi-associated nuclease n=1 Tax=Cordylochernes scorpioides TaxID=51811 RepID=A0ABY6KLV7_9ARAC|nr:FAN1 [Cordylochernes scorpioides]
MLKTHARKHGSTIGWTRQVTQNAQLVPIAMMMGDLHPTCLSDLLGTLDNKPDCPGIERIRMAEHERSVKRNRELTSTERIPRWRLGERPSDMKASCETSRITLTNKQSRTNSSIVRRGGYGGAVSVLMLESAEKASASMLGTTSNYRQRDDDQCGVPRFPDVPQFLHKFSAAHVYLHTASHGIEVLQRLKRYKQAAELLQFLLQQKVTHVYTPFHEEGQSLLSYKDLCQDHRGRWWERLALNWEVHLKDRTQSLQVLEQALQDPALKPAHIHSLLSRLQRLSPDSAAQLATTVPLAPSIPMECGAISSKDRIPIWHFPPHNTEENNTLEQLSQRPSKETRISLQFYFNMEEGAHFSQGHPLYKSHSKSITLYLRGARDGPYYPMVTIEGQLVPKAVPGRRNVFMTSGGAGDVVVVSVEGVALQHYKDVGYSCGVHGEGATMCSLFGLFLWESIYQAMENVFITPYQSTPLDLTSLHFLESRRESITATLAAVRDFTPQLESRVQEVWEAHHGESSLVSWDLFTSLSHLQGLVRCLGGQLIADICERLAADFRHWRSGAPDLVVWQPGLEHRFRFVEVKGPGDQLSSKQTLWLDFLANSCQVPAEVCYVLVHMVQAMIIMIGPCTLITIPANPGGGGVWSMEHIRSVHAP